MMMMIDVYSFFVFILTALIYERFIAINHYLRYIMNIQFCHRAPIFISINLDMKQVICES